MTPEQYLNVIGALCGALAAIVIVGFVVFRFYTLCYEQIRYQLYTHTPLQGEELDFVAFSVVMTLWSVLAFAGSFGVRWFL